MDEDEIIAKSKFNLFSLETHFCFLMLSRERNALSSLDVGWYLASGSESVQLGKTF